MRVPDAGPAERDRLALIARFEKKLAYFQRIPAHRQSLMYAAELEHLPGIILICHRDTDPSLCLKHGYLIEQTMNWWRIGMTAWQCGADDLRLDQCRRVEYMQEGSP